MRKQLFYTAILLALVAGMFGGNVTPAFAEGDVVQVFEAWDVQGTIRLPQYDVSLMSDGSYHQLDIPPVAEREPFMVELTLVDGSAYFSGPSCGLTLDEHALDEAGNPVLRKVVALGNSGNNVAFTVESASADDQIATGEVICWDSSGEEVNGFQITTEPVGSDSSVIYPAYFEDGTLAEGYEVVLLETADGNWWMQPNLPLAEDRLAFTVSDISVPAGDYFADGKVCSFYVQYGVDGEPQLVAQEENRIPFTVEDRGEDMPAFVSFECAGGTGSGASFYDQ